MLEDVRKSKALSLYEALLIRRRLSKEEEGQYYNELQGFRGEKKFAGLLRQHVDGEFISLYGLLLRQRSSIFEMDCLLILRKQLFMIEVKSFLGEYSLRDDQFYAEKAQRAYPNPIHQLKRAETNLVGLLTQMNISAPVHSFVVFVNESFTLFTERNPMIILPTQLDEFFSHINQLAGGITSAHEKLATRLSELHLTDNPYEQLPVVDYHQLNKGLFCHSCKKRLTKRRYGVFCRGCLQYESVDSAIMHAVVDFQTLFPNEAIKTAVIFDWIGEMFSKNTIRKVLKTNLKRYGSHKKTEYRFE